MVSAAIWILGALFAQERTPEQLIQLLRSDRIQDRDIAVQGLRALGEKAIPLLLPVEKDADVEVARRAAEIIKDIKDPLWRESAEETFRRMDERIRSAKTISVRLKQGYEQSGRPADLQSLPFTTFKLKSDGRFWIGYPDSPKKNRRIIAVSDGKTSWPPAPTVLQDPKEATKYLILGFTKVGTGFSLMMPMAAQRGTEPDETASLAEFSLAGQDSVGRIIAYRINLNVTGVTSEKVESKLWLDQKSRLPKRREVSFGTGVNLQKFIEIYEGWELDSTIPDDTFTLPLREPPKEEFFRNLDIVEPAQRNMMHGPQDVVLVDGVIQSGTLIYDGNGNASERCAEFVADMKQCGWMSLPEKTVVADGRAIMQKDHRTCTVTFSASRGGYKATIRVEESK